MNRFIKQSYSRFRNLILYGIIGTFAASIDFVIFTLLTQYTSIYHILANCLSVITGISTSFYLNRSLNFKVKDKTGKRFMIFLFIGLSGLLLSNIILYLGIDIFSGDEIIVKLASIAIVAFFQFLLNKFITFKKSI